MSFSIRNIREISNDPLTKYVNQIAKKLAKFTTANETDKLENKEDIYSAGQDIETVLRYNSLCSTSYFDDSKQYYPTFEPDLQYNTCWIKGLNIGNDTRDLSEFGNVATINGDPVLMDGAPFDLGIMAGGTKSTCVRYNRPTSFLENEEYMSVTDAARIQVSGISTGISFFIRFRLSSLASQGGQDRTLFCKIDDSTPNNAYMAQVTSGGKLQFFIKRAGSNVVLKETASSTIAVNTVYEVFLTYANSGNTAHVYVNNVDKTLTTPSAPTWPTGADHNLSIFRKHSTVDGYVYGDFYDFMVYRNKVVSAAEVGYHYTNKWTIANIPFGQCMISNYWAALEEAPSPSIHSFSSTSFTSTSFT